MHSAPPARWSSVRSTNGAALLRAEQRPDVLGDLHALERRARPVGIAPPHALLGTLRERGAVAAHDVMRHRERGAAEARDARAHFAAIAVLRRGKELAVRRDKRHREMLVAHAL